MAGNLFDIALKYIYFLKISKYENRVYPNRNRTEIFGLGPSLGLDDSKTKTESNFHI